GTAIFISSQRPHPLPLCASARTVAPHPRHRPRPPGTRAAIHCVIPRTHHWAGVAAPTQRDTTPALDRARRASDVINISNSTSIDKPLWQLEAPAGPKPRPGRGQRQPVAGRAAARRPAPDGTGPRCLGALATAGWIVLSWLAAVPRRLG